MGFGKTAKSVARGVAHSFENEARRMAKRKDFTPEMKDNYERFADGMHNLGEGLQDKNDYDDEY